MGSGGRGGMGDGRGVEKRWMEEWMKWKQK